ncbi:probable helicase senataxin [Chanos chanos]|uniref:Probable helicase senataxin n=1 Tax=Chanos chanos TaxID=29144 RepID=A0A6J2UUP3_CHACN|nr:probable helicase senataxin [Chanos chanos]
MDTCRWCRTAGRGEAAVSDLLRRYSSAALPSEELKNANEDLSFCMECVVAYHNARENAPVLHERLWNLEISRLLGVFRPLLELELEDDDLLIVEGDQELPVSKFSLAEFHDCLRFPFTEVLKYPYLLCHPELCEMVEKVLCKMEEMSDPLQLFDKLQGIYLFMVHPNKTVRRWAIREAQLKGKVDRDSYYDLQEVFTCMFYVIELGISLNISDIDDSYHTKSKILRLPPHLYDSSSEKNYWLGICMLLMQLDSQAMDSLFTGLERQTNIPQCILNTMDQSREDDPASDPFWPALHCFMVILDRLGSKIWAQIEPAPAFHAITGSASYTAEIENIRQRTMMSRVKVELESDDMVTCSQMVYDCYAAEKRNKLARSSSSCSDSSSSMIFEEMNSLVSVLQSEMGQSLRVYGSTFLWFIPFVRSVMELSELSVMYISEVINYLCNKINCDILKGHADTPDKVTEFFTRILIYIIEQHLSKGCMGLLYHCPRKWIEVVVMWVAFTGDSMGGPDGTGAAHLVSSTSSLRCGLQAFPVTGRVNPMTQACMRLIRSLLREGGRLGTVPRSNHFLNLLNKQLREVPSRGWSLTRSEIVELQQCLKELVKKMFEKPAVTPIGGSSASPTPPVEAPENMVDAATSTHLGDMGSSSAGGKVLRIKEEQIWDYEVHSPRAEVGFCSGLEEVLKVKKEPQTAVPISEMIPGVEKMSLKPDLEKFQEIKSKLNENPRLLKMQAIAKRTTHGASHTEQNELYRLNDEPDEEADDVPLNVLRKRLKKTHRLESDDSDVDDKSQKRKDLDSSIIIISDDEISVSEGGSSKGHCFSGKEELKTKEELMEPAQMESPKRDYDVDLSESQVFEFETQEFVASAWGDSGLKMSPSATSPKGNLSHKGSFSPNSAEPSSSLDNEVDPIPDEDIEQACLEVEEQIKMQQQQTAVCLPVTQKQSVATEQVFIKPKTLPVKSPSKKISVAQKKAKVPPVIAPLAQKLKRSSKSQVLKTISTTPSSPSHTSAPLHPLSPSSSFSSPSFATPAIVPPKKVRAPIQPESTAERLGLKKKERKAFDLSQRSLVCLGKLRRYGQNVRVDQPQKKQIRRTSKTTKVISPQKLMVKGNKKLLASQDLQFFRQSREKNKKTSTSKAQSVAALKSTKQVSVQQPVTPKDVRPTNKEQGEGDKLISLPCPHPDLALRLKDAQVVSEASTSGAGEPADGRDYLTKNSEAIKSKYFCQDNDEANVSADTVGKGGIAETDKDEHEWMFLTQMEPTDMELCSQIDDPQEEDNDESLFLTQRDPVDMELETDSQMNMAGEEIWVAPQPLDPSPGQTAPFTTPIVSTARDDHKFLKPGMSPMSLKRAKPSTTKIYTPNSRSDSLALDMEKGSKPPSLAKGKFARPSVLPTPKPPSQPEFCQPRHLPRPPTHAPRAISYSSANDILHPPTYKTYPRPEAPGTNAMPSLDTGQKYDPLILTRAVLKWKYSMFDNYRQFGTPSDLLPLKEMPTKFSSYEEYFGTIYPLMLTSAFEEMANEWMKGVKVMQRLKVEGIEYSNRIANANFKTTLTREQEGKQLYAKEGDFVVLWLPQNRGAYASDEPEFGEPSPHFGYVNRSNLSTGEDKNLLLNLNIQTYGNVSSVNTQTVQCDVIGSLISMFREFRALCMLKSGIMKVPLLAPHISFFQCSQNDMPDLDIPEYNMDQTRAIARGVSIVRRQRGPEAFRSPRILLIHGPPGTGKSKTIVGLLYSLLVNDTAQTPTAMRQPKFRQQRILLCAPSNAAVDSLMKKVIPFFKEKQRNKKFPQGTCGDINLVRLGNEKISEDLKDFSLDRQTRNRTQKLQQPTDADIRRKTVLLDQRIENVSRKCASTKRGSAEFQQLTEEKVKLLREREGLSKQLREARSRKHATQVKILTEANVICSTLSSSGCSLLESAFRHLGYEPFSCIIIDEAGQATETETLIPMMYRCPALILVGDPDQLPPTVISQKAKEMGYDQSLMARLWKNLRQMNPSPIVFLSTQYRMHPDICEFPSKYVYGKALKTDCETAQKRCAERWPFQPYRVFDVTDGRENKENESYSNLKEVRLVLLLLKLVCEKQVGRVGVITPYNGQKQKILEAIARESGRDNKRQLPVEVDTVDGFQGKERDCIIVSCVRASSEMGSIGFVGNRQRMNVTITRAKFSLFILGHLRTLGQSDWGALIEDAERRGTIIKTQERDFHADARKIFKPRALSRSMSHPPAAPVLSRSLSTDHRPDLFTGHAPNRPKELHRTLPLPTPDASGDSRLAVRRATSHAALVYPPTRWEDSRDSPPPGSSDPPRDPRLHRREYRRDEDRRSRDEQRERTHREGSRDRALERRDSSHYSHQTAKRSQEPHWSSSSSSSPKRKRR